METANPITDPEFVKTCLGAKVLSPDFTEAWSEWVGHRQDMKKPLNLRSAKMALKILKEMGSARAVVAIQHSIANGYKWKGIYEPTAKQAKEQRPVTAPNMPSKREQAEREAQFAEWRKK